MKQLFNIHKIINFIILTAIFKFINLKIFIQNEISNNDNNIDTNSNNNSDSEDYKLQFVFEIMRHGARSPSHLDLSSSSSEEDEDIFHEKWPDGKGELTSIGITQHFLIGFRNRLRYIDRFKLLNENFDLNEIYLISTPLNRTLMSINAEIQGMFLPGTGPCLYKNESDIADPPLKSNINYIDEKKNLDENYSFAAIRENINVLPVSIFDPEELNSQLVEKEHCKALKSNYKNRYDSKRYTKFYEQLDKKYGDKLKKILDKTYVYNNHEIIKIITDTAIADFTENKTMSKISKHLNRAEFQDFVDNFAFNFSYLDYIGSDEKNDKMIAKVGASQIFNKIIEYMDGIKEQKTKLKFVLFSMHESNLGPFTYFLKLALKKKFPVKYANFSANAHLELYKKKNDKYYVNFLFNDESIFNISYSDFRRKIKRLIMDNDAIHFYCDEEDKNKYEIIVAILLSIIVLLIIILIFLYFKKFKKKIIMENIVLENLTK